MIITFYIENYIIFINLKLLKFILLDDIYLL
jgi:hypothetical protein